MRDHRTQDLNDAARRLGEQKSTFLETLGFVADYQMSTAQQDKSYYRPSRRSRMQSLLRILSFSSVLVLAGQAPVNAQERLSPPVSTSAFGPSGPVEIWGHERLAWDQPSPDPDSLAHLIFTAYVDGLIDLLEDVRCSSERNVSGFECSSRLPRMSPGPHAIEITATDRADTVSERSAALNVVLHARTVESVAPTTAHGDLRTDVELVVGALVNVADIAALPDGTVLIGEERGRILTTSPGKLPTTAVDLRTLDLSATQIELLALAVAPDFDETHAVFAAYITHRGLRLARFTESNGVLLNHAVLREDLPLAAPFAPSAALGVGPDNKIYLAINDHVFRLNIDGSTPADGSASGLFSRGVHQPEKLTWNIREQVMWLLGSTLHGGSELQAIALGDRGRGTTLRSYALGPLNVTSVAFLPESPGRSSRLIVTARDSSDLLHWRTSEGELDQATWLTGKQLDGATAMVARSGSLWIASRSGLFRIDLSRQ